MACLLPFAGQAPHLPKSRKCNLAILAGSEGESSLDLAVAVQRPHDEFLRVGEKGLTS
jgi:hypothetical protein